MIKLSLKKVSVPITASLFLFCSQKNVFAEVSDDCVVVKGIFEINPGHATGGEKDVTDGEYGRNPGNCPQENYAKPPTGAGLAHL